MIFVPSGIDKELLGQDFGEGAPGEKLEQGNNVWERSCACGEASIISYC